MSRTTDANPAKILTPTHSRHKLFFVRLDFLRTRVSRRELLGILGFHTFNFRGLYLHHMLDVSNHLDFLLTKVNRTAPHSRLS